MHSIFKISAIEDEFSTERREKLLEMMEAEKEAKEKTKRVIKVPKGTSEYQAAWIMDKPGMATQLNSV